MKSFLKTISLLASSLFLGLVLSSCASLSGDINTETHKAPGINLNAYKTYNWLGSAEIIFDPIGQWEQPTLDTDEEVKTAIERELTKHGIKSTESHPDLLVAFAAGIDTTVLELKEDPDLNMRELHNVPKAALLIALIDANTGYVIWHGFAEGNAQQQRSIEDIRARIDYAVKEIFESFNK